MLRMNATHKRMKLASVQKLNGSDLFKAAPICRGKRGGSHNHCPSGSDGSSQRGEKQWTEYPKMKNWLGASSVQKRTMVLILWFGAFKLSLKR
jgi:hypothetical protein